MVLDVGSGTGIIADAIAPLVKCVTAMDISWEMLRYSKPLEHKFFVQWDIREPLYNANHFDKIVARHVLHHILPDPLVALKECYRILRPGGLIIVSEGVPPSEKARPEYEKIFELKEERITFSEAQLASLMAGFKGVSLGVHWLKQMSVRNWLQNSGLPQDTQNEIYALHTGCSHHFREAYRMTELEDDCLIDMKMLILTGRK